MSNAIKKINLPSGWAWMSLMEAYEYLPTGVKEYEGILKYFSTGSVKGKAFLQEGEYTYLNRPSRANRQGFLGDVFQARMADTDKSFAINNVLQKSLFSTGFIQLRPHDPSKEATSYLFYLMQAGMFLRQRDGFATGSTQVALTDRGARNIMVPIAPKEQQKCIVAKIEELFSHIDAGIEGLKKAKQLLKQYRQSVLKAAVTGELTREWRKVNERSQSSDWLDRINKIKKELLETKEIAKPKKTVAISDDVPFQLPEAWTWVRLDDFVLTSVDCPHSTPKYKEQGSKCVRTSDFLPGKLTLDNVRYVTAESFDERNKRLVPQPNDVLYSREGGILGIACMIPENEEVCLGQRMMIFRTESKLASLYLMHNLNSPLIINRVKGLVGGSASPHLNVGDIRNFLLPIPPEDESTVLMSLLEQRLASIERLERDLDLQFLKAKKNKQSILASAFSGKLVPQEKEEQDTYLMAAESRSEYGEKRA